MFTCGSGKPGGSGASNMGLSACDQGGFWERTHWKVTESLNLEGWFEATEPRLEGSIMNTEQSSLGWDPQIISTRLSYSFVSVAICSYFTSKDL